MRVIAGSARRLLLKTVEGMDTRPTQDRIKETLFNMIQNDLYGVAFLDLFAGSGGIGIEALSRGAGSAVFIDNGSRQVACIKDNLKITKLEDKAQVICGDVISSLKMLENAGKKFDFVFMDPPYNQGHEMRVMEAISKTSITDEETVFIIEASLETSFSWVSDMGYEVTRSKEYKTNKHVFLRKAIEE